MKRALLFALTAILALSQTKNPAWPKGEANPHVTQENIQQTICQSGWTATIRPTATYTTRLKIQQMKEQHLPGAAADYEEDHFISLEIGGHPTSPDNLWPQLWVSPDGLGARIKDQVEDELHRRVCAGSMPLVEAQECIRADWVVCGRRIGKVK